MNAFTVQFSFTGVCEHTVHHYPSSASSATLKHALHKVIPFPCLSIDSPLCQHVLHLFSYTTPLSSFNRPRISPFFLAWGCDWLLVPVPGTPNGSCNYHCSTTVLSVCSPAKQEGSFGSPDQKLWPLIMKQKEKPKHCAKSTRNVPKRAQENGNDSHLEDVLNSSSAMTRWCQEHRCLGSVWSDPRKQGTERVTHAVMMLL